MARSAVGSVRPYKDGYRVVIEGQRDPITGKRNRPSKVVRGSKKQAERVKADLILKAGGDVESSMTVKEYGDTLYLPVKVNELKRSSFAEYKRRLNTYIYPYLGNIQLKDLRVSTIKSWLASLDKPTVRRESYKMLERMLTSAVYDDHLIANPCERIKTPRVPHYEPDTLDIYDIAVYLYFFRGSSVEAAVLLAIGCGMRRGEICGLDAEDINIKTGLVSISKTYLCIAGKCREDTPKSESGYRELHLPKILLERLVEIMPLSGHILRGKDGVCRMNPSAVTHTYERTVARMPDEVPRISLKNLRHSSLTLAYDESDDLLGVKDRAGHSNESITSRYYVRTKGTHDAAITKQIDNALSRVAKCAKQNRLKTIKVYSDSVKNF
ncbi:MAG: site-specific integrase [Eggerthellaceae bacterium]|nr:site-specific integrase [Eggerthellaceae bacterium]MCH4220462.1 site-specific integrase [Eggerthellaceae bacterium]